MSKNIFGGTNNNINVSSNIPVSQSTNTPANILTTNKTSSVIKYTSELLNLEYLTLARNLNKWQIGPSLANNGFYIDSDDNGEE